MTTEYTKMVAALAKPGEAILESMTPQKAHILHMAVGVSGEVSELFDAVTALSSDRINIMEELGDIEFYLEGLREAVGISREETTDPSPAEQNSVDAGVELVAFAGSLLDAVKKHIFYNKALAREALVFLLSEIEIDMHSLRTAFDLSRGEILKANMEKLAVRYSAATYSDEAAQARADKAI